MKDLKKQMGVIALFITALMLYQGCDVYKKAPVTIEEAATEEYSVKVSTIDNKTVNYHHIELKNGQYFGVKHVDRKQIFVPLKKVRSILFNKKDKVRSSAGNTAIVAPIIGIVLILIGAVAII